MTISDSLPRPVVGLTTYLDPAVTEGCGTIEAAFLPQNYLAPVLAAGAIPVLLPPQGTDGGVLEQLLPRLDGVIVVGGWDVDPARYGAEPHAETDRPHRLRDAWDSAVVQEAVRTDLPLLGICRGEQILNVALGGSLHQHLPDLVGEGTYQPGDHRFNPIPVDLRPGSHVAQILGCTHVEAVPVSHHQAVDRLGSGLQASAWSAHGVVEAIELPQNRFCIGVQWHPEQSPTETALFDAFVQAARERQLGRSLPIQVDAALRDVSLSAS
ncbi:gamma-glutamyl-gamma-aminobutyrate hydrolase family protein [Arthrobacter cheniae]|uniref:Gamma-glutamyl-gamma-aminobutyrate hydrolase family protein n=1 Tax=Arthrobacter cheniae TaxID=1258888 RepID=A0A3A5M7I2_9MICC|nr:gamma-glutamyl-gamma-aminobutyrate hydrolase family protein [Arthrobacter cheniae]RJT83112.1 gamma-glutamyl-gamma-aminobutyrate hydrolase family protein [Arthrobacter cheniae]